MDTRQAQASLLHGNQFLTCFNDMRIDIRLSEALELGHIVRKYIQVHYHHTDGKPYLGSSQPHPVGTVHRFMHVLDKLFQIRIIGCYILGFFTKDRLSIYINR